MTSVTLRTISFIAVSPAPARQLEALLLALVKISHACFRPDWGLEIANVAKVVMVNSGLS